MAVLEAISTTYLEADASSVTFGSIPSTYEHLQLRVSAQSNRAYQVDALGVNFNGDTGSNYWVQYMRGTGTSKSGWASAAVTEGSFYVALSGKYEVGRYGFLVADIFDYANANKNTTMTGVEGHFGKTSAGVDSPGVGLTSILWDNVAAVTSIALAPRNGTNFVRGSEFTLYGLNSA